VLCAVKTPEDEGRQLESDPLRILGSCSFYKLSSLDLWISSSVFFVLTILLILLTKKQRYKQTKKDTKKSIENNTPFPDVSRTG